MKMHLHTRIGVFILFIFLYSCSIQKQIARMAQGVIKDSALTTAHVGITIYDDASGKSLFDHQGDKYFVPASNTKIPTCYAAMKYLPEKIPGARYFEDDTSLVIIPSGDPTFLHSEFSVHPVLEHLKISGKKIFVANFNWKDQAWGSGWSWNDYNESYMAERSPMPLYGNTIRWIQEKPETGPAVIYSIPEVEWPVQFNVTTVKSFSARRDLASNTFTLTEGQEKKRELSIPYITNGVTTAAELLTAELSKPVNVSYREIPKTYSKVIYSQYLDSILKPMMHRSDNFYAEQMLMMVSDHVLGYMDDSRIVDTILKTELKDLPQKPRWADGSGLSRYNLFTPRDMVSILGKMKKEFGYERLKVIFPTGNEGTLSNYYKDDSTYVYAKTGTLSGVVAISGFLTTQKNRVLVFSVLVNNHQASAATIRRKVEAFLKQIRAKY